MTVAYSVDNILPLLKEVYPVDRVEDLFLTESPFWLDVPRNNDVGGNPTHPVPIKYGLSGATSTNITTVRLQAEANAPGNDTFDVPLINWHAWAKIASNAMRLAKQKGKKAFISAYDDHLQDLAKRFGREQSIDLYATGYGELGRIAEGTSVSGTTLSLDEDYGDAVNFAIGDYVDFVDSGDLAGNTKRSRGSGISDTGLRVVGVDRQSNPNTITVAADADDATNGVPSVTAGDYIVRAGAKDSAARSKIVGLGGWLVSGSSPGTLFGVNRNLDPQKLAGTHVDGAGKDIVGAVNKAMVACMRLDAMPDKIYCNPEVMGRFYDKASNLQIQDIDKANGSATFSTRAIRINTKYGVLEVNPDKFAPKNKLFFLHKKSWQMNCVGEEMFRIGDGSNEDGLSLLRDPYTNDFITRMNFYGSLSCNAPGLNVVLTLPSN